MLMDRLTKKARSELMAKVRSADTKPELVVRRIVTDLKYRYRVHAAALPGRPDLAITSLRKAIFVHGCFWHQHEDCRLARLPKSRLEYWLPKLRANRKRDSRSRGALTRQGWGSLVVWECQIKNTSALTRRLRSFLA